MAKKSYTVLLVPDGAPVRRYQIPKNLLIQTAGAISGLGLLLLVGTLHYLHVVGEAAESRVLKDENVTLRGQLKVLRERIDHIGSTLDRVERFDQKLRAITLLSDPQRNLALGPTGSEPATQVPPTSDGLTPLKASDNPKALDSRLDKLSADVTRREQSLQELTAFFQEQKSLLASVPSTWPARGWVTSDFGQRVDPYTSERVMHTGLDIAAEFGKSVYAPSNGTVVFAGPEGGYGNVIVVDHGYGIKTRYGHLSQLLVKAGEKVKRGQQVAAIGNTGRSTGPHLHYEVRVNGLAQNPRKFILDE